jgi:hypothetical protein
VAARLGKEVQHGVLPNELMVMALSIEDLVDCCRYLLFGFGA